MERSCDHCHAIYEDDDYSLCPACELRFALLPLRLAAWLDPLRASLDATVHPGGHRPTRVIPPTAPTPIRLNVLDLLDQIDARARALWRRLEGVDALDWRRDSRPPRDLGMLLADIATHPRLAKIDEADMWMRTFEQLCTQVLAVIDVPDRMKPIGNCLNPLCGVQLKAADAQTTVECPVCGLAWKVADVRLGLIRSLADSDRLLTLTDCAKLLTECGYQVSRKQLQNWRDRGKLVAQARESKGRQLFRMGDVVATLRGGFDGNPK